MLMRTFFSLTFTIVGMTLCSLMQASTIVTDGLVSYWTFDRGHTFDRKIKDMWGENDATISGIQSSFQDILDMPWILMQVRIMSI